MEEDTIFLTLKSVLFIKHSLQRTLLVFTMLFAVYICSISLKQSGIETQQQRPKLKVLGVSSSDYGSTVSQTDTQIEFLERPSSEYVKSKRTLTVNSVEVLEQDNGGEKSERGAKVEVLERSSHEYDGDRDQVEAEIEALPSPCYNRGSNKSQMPYLHYPEPKTFSRGECACNPVRLFVIVSTQRSGSRWLETLLNSHTNVSSTGEVFKPYKNHANISSIRNTMDTVYNLDLTNSPKNECLASVGLKWMLNQGLLAHHDQILDYFNSRGVSVIFLFRRNLLRQKLSNLANVYDGKTKLVKGTHKAHVKSAKEAEALSKFKPWINCKSLRREFKGTNAAISKALKYFSSTRNTVLYYEDLMRNSSKLVDVQEFLGLPVMNLTSPQVKIHKGPLSEHIKNWDDVNKALRGTIYESFLSADY